MAKTTKKQETPKEAAVVTRAEKKDATKNLIKERLAVKPHKHNELIEGVANLYAERFSGEDTENMNDVKGRVGSVLDIMKKEGDVAYEGGMYALKARALPEPPVKQAETKPVKKTAKKTVKSAEKVEKAVEKAAETTEKKPAKRTVKKAKTEPVQEETAVKAEEKPVKKTARRTKKAEPMPAQPLQPIAPVAPVTPDVAPEPIPEDKPAPKKRGRKPKAKVEETLLAAVKDAVPTAVEEPVAVEAVKSVEPLVAEEKQPETVAMAPVAVEEVKAEPVSEPVVALVPEPVVALVPEPVETQPKKEVGLVVKTPAPLAQKNVMDMSFLFAEKKPAKPFVKEEKQPEKAEKKPETKVESSAKTEEKPVVKAEKKAEIKSESKPVQSMPKTEIKSESKPVQQPKQVHNVRKLSEVNTHTLRKSTPKAQTADEKLCEAFLKRIRSLGGDYFEYYSVYLLERYSMKNGRRLEGLRINGGDRDGGIDGEIELTDKLGFKETIYIQSKNWNPEKGDEKLWVVGETLLQQFIGACACRQARDGKQNCRGIFITTSRFTPEAKRLLDVMSDKIVGYDGNDLYEAAKECSFGLVEKNGVWTLDERVLSGNKVFFNLF